MPGLKAGRAACKLGSRSAVSFLSSWLKARNENQFVPLGDIKADFLIEVV